jgi:2-hydroxymuconate-semialdehyde hydrolase
MQHEIPNGRAKGEGVAATSALTTEVTHERVTVDGREVMVHRAGAGNAQALVFLHGGGPGATGWSNWRHALPALGSRYDCIAPDFIGFGDSHHPDPPPTDPRAWNRLRINMVIGLLDELGVGRASLVGNSLGGAISLHLLMEAPERFDRAVLMGTAGGPSSHSPRQEVLKMVTFYNDPSPEALARLYSWFVYDLDNFDGDLDEIARDRFQQTMRPEVRRSYEAMFAGPLMLALPESALRRIVHPILIVHGRDDTVNPLEDSVYFLHALPNAGMFVFPRCGHWTQLEYPEKFHNLLDQFFSDGI